MDLVNQEQFSEMQLLIVESRLQPEPLTYDEIRSKIFQKYAFTVHDSTIKRVLKRSALNLK